MPIIFLYCRVLPWDFTPLVSFRAISDVLLRRFTRVVHYLMADHVRFPDPTVEQTSRRSSSCSTRRSACSLDHWVTWVAGVLTHPRTGNHSPPIGWY